MSIVMLKRILAIIVIAPLSVVLAGCACPSGGCIPRTPCAPCENELTVPGHELPDFFELTQSECELVPLPTPTETYQLLDAATCQCRAVTNATLANMVELERHWAKVIIECDSKTVRENLCLDRDLLALHATGLRNKAAGDALRVFYQLAGLEVQKQYLALGVEESRLTLQRLDKLRSKGLDLPKGIDRSQVSKNLAELEEKQMQLALMRIQLNGQLQKLIGCPLDEYSFYWPQMDWQPDLSAIDLEAELAQGLATRSDLRGISLVLCKLEKPTLPIARGVLKFADSTIGSVEPQGGMIHFIRCLRCSEAELPVRCRQLALFYEHTEQGATAEIKGAGYECHLHQQRVVSSLANLAQLQDHLHELKETRDINGVSIFEISRAKAQVYDAQVKMIEQVVQLNLAQVSLRKAQGMLTVECGCCPKLCCEGCCDGACCRCEKKTCSKPRCSCSKSSCCKK